MRPDAIKTNMVINFFGTIIVDAAMELSMMPVLLICAEAVRDGELLVEFILLALAQSRDMCVGVLKVTEAVSSV